MEVESSLTVRRKEMLKALWVKNPKLMFYMILYVSARHIRILEMDLDFLEIVVTKFARDKFRQEKPLYIGICHRCYQGYVLEEFCKNM